jgi:hypothetical protein
MGTRSHMQCQRSLLILLMAFKGKMTPSLTGLSVWWLRVAWMRYSIHSRIAYGARPITSVRLILISHNISIMVWPATSTHISHHQSEDMRTFWPIAYLRRPLMLNRFHRLWPTRTVWRSNAIRWICAIEMPDSRVERRLITIFTFSSR